MLTICMAFSKRYGCIYKFANSVILDEHVEFEISELNYANLFYLMLFMYHIKALCF